MGMYNSNNSSHCLMLQQTQKECEANELFKTNHWLQAIDNTTETTTFTTGIMTWVRAYDADVLLKNFASAGHWAANC